ncbi:MAG: 3'(2'),5'-bisphosphate nucleotidase CysQ [Mycobacteriaceae bacterium]
MSADQELAEDLAREAGQLLIGLQSSGPTGRELGKLGDRESNALLMSRLAAQRPDDAVLSEESADDPARLSAERVWIIDPVDGTREYGMGGRPDWAVHVALWERSGISAAAVALPALDCVLGTGSLASTFGLLPKRSSERPRILVSGSRPPAFAQAVADVLGGDLVPLGSAGAKSAAVILGEADAYVHAGGQYQWDSAAPVGVAQAHGLHCSRIDGSPLQYNAAETWLPDVVLCRNDLRDAVLEAIAAEGA